MNEQIERNRMELILALRSGRYTQLKMRLNNGKPDEFCFAGLGMNLFGIHTVKGETFKAFQSLANRLNLDYIRGAKGKLGNLIRQNDFGNKTFPELADILVKDYGFPDVHIEDIQKRAYEIAVEEMELV